MPEMGEGISHQVTWCRAFQAKGMASAKVLRQEELLDRCEE